MEVSVIKYGKLLLILSFLSSLVLCEEILIVRGDGQYPPYESDSGELKGLHIDIVNEVEKITGDKIKIISVPWKRAIAMVKNGQAHAITFAGKNDERSEFLHFHPDNILSTSKISLLIHRSNTYRFPWNGNVKLLEGHTIVKMRGFYYGEKITALNDLKVINVNQYIKQAELIANDRAHFAIADYVEFKTVLKHTDYINSIIILDPPVETIPNYLAFSKKKSNMNLVKKYAKAMKQLRASKRYQEILKKYDLKE